VGTEMTVICSAYDKGVLIGIETQDITTYKDIAEVYFSSENAMNADSIKLMVFDSLEGLKPLQNAVKVDCFDNDASVIATVENGMCKVSGQLKDSAENENVMITVFSQDTRRSSLTEEKVAPYILYQNQIKSDKNGMYEFSFKLPPNYGETSAMVMISTKNDTIQSVIPTVK
ncbi:hypothetical protein, partial [Dubosiella newyorkensis]|uniref:hypothetical protein n=1 Tax=Dubosiella newyorkensis TaxID=1862672 RepID=UPI00259D224F